MSKLPLNITPKWLENRDACKDQVNLFYKEWPHGCDVTEENLNRAAAIGMNLEWFAERILPHSLYADYEAKRAPLDADYRAKLAPLDADYEAKHAPLDADYEAKRAPLDADYRAKRAAILITIMWDYYAPFVAKAEMAAKGQGVSK